MQPIGRSSLLEEVGERLVPAPVPGNGGMVAEQQRAVGSADAQIMAAKEPAAHRRESSPPTSELSTGKMNPRAPGWNKRLRIGAAAQSRTPCQIGSVHLRRLSGVMLTTQLKMSSHQFLGLVLTLWARRTTSTICTLGRRALQSEMHAGNSVWLFGEYKIFFR